MFEQTRNTVLVRYFGGSRELVGVSEERLALALPCTVADLLQTLASRHPRLAPIASRLRLAVGDELAVADTLVTADAEVSVIPPVAGGTDSARCAMRREPLSIDAAVAQVARPGAGAITLFIGTVRDHADGKSVARLDYEAHPRLALHELERVASEVTEHFPQARLAIQHRIGELAVGDLAVVVAASSPHRAEAFAACREAIEAIKERVPIWKKEWAEDGSAHWVNLGAG